MNLKKQSESARSEQVRDNRIGKRVLCLSLLPTCVYGTIQNITRYVSGVEYWEVLSEHHMMLNAPSTSFILYSYAEFHSGDLIHYRLDRDCCDGVVLGAIVTNGQVGFSIRIEDASRDRGKTKTQEFTAHPTG